MIAALEAAWATAKIDAAYAAILRTIVDPQLLTEPQSRTVWLADLVDLCCLAQGGDAWRLAVIPTMSVLPPSQRVHVRALLHAAPTDPAAETQTRSQILSAGAALYVATESRRWYGRASETPCEAVPDSSARDGLLKLLNRYTPLKDQ